MAEFKGFKQVTYESFSGLSSEQKAGYLWFVRSNISGDTYVGDIYLGSRHYGHYGTETEALEAQIREILTEYLTKAEAAATYVKNTTLYGDNGVFIIDGDDVSNE